MVDLPLPHLDPTEASLLLARRARRPFFPCDFGAAAAAGAAAGAPLRLGPELLRQLNESPMMRALKGGVKDGECGGNLKFDGKREKIQK